MGKCIVFENAAGGVSVITPVGDATVESQVKFVPVGAGHEIVDERELPNDRLFRDAWKKRGKKVETDLASSKRLAHDWRRSVREEELSPLDKEVTIHIKNPTKIDGIESQRQVIRDKHAAIQTEIDDCMDEGKLRSVVSKRKLDPR